MKRAGELGGGAGTGGEGEEGKERNERALWACGERRGAEEGGDPGRSRERERERESGSVRVSLHCVATYRKNTKHINDWSKIRHQLFLANTVECQGIVP